MQADVCTCARSKFRFERNKNADLWLYCRGMKVVELYHHLRPGEIMFLQISDGFAIQKREAFILRLGRSGCYPALAPIVKYWFWKITSSLSKAPTATGFDLRRSFGGYSNTPSRHCFS
jgi:hypothetical protein